MSKWRDRQRKEARRKAFKDPKPLILIVCEGKNTEPQYFNGLATACRNPLVRYQILDTQGDPQYLVREAKAEKTRSDLDAKRNEDDNLKYDAVWCVPDIDDHKYISEARQMATANGIEIVFSNPCFELWLVLHFRESPGMKHRDQLRQIMKKHIRNYQKDVDFTDYQPGYLQAVKRAERLVARADAENESGRNPTTDVYRLTQLIAGLHPEFAT